MLTHYPIFRNRFFRPSQQVLKLPGKEGIHHFGFRTFLRVLGAASKLRLEIRLLDNWIVFTWRHNRHVDVPNPSCGSLTFFLCKNVFFFQYAYLLATWVERLILKHCEQWKRRPTIFFFCQAQFKRRTFHYQTPSIKYKKRLTFESIKSDISNMGRPMRTWEFRLRNDVDWFSRDEPNA